MLKPENWFKDEKGVLIKVLACPYCGEIISKGDDGCDRMTCFKCKNLLNYCCSSRRSPTVEHGNHYHRPSCIRYDEDVKKYVDAGCKEDKVEKKCEECIRLGKLCERPLDLYEGVFPHELVDKYLS